MRMRNNYKIKELKFKEMKVEYKQEIKLDMSYLTNILDLENVDISDFKILVLTELQYKYTANYLSFKSVDRLDKEIGLKDFRLEKYPNKELNHICNDGAGFATPQFFRHIKKKLHLTDELSWVKFRTIGNAGKGIMM